MHVRRYQPARVPTARSVRRRSVSSTKTANKLASFAIDDALRRAEEAGLDLIEVAATADPPVCRIADLGRFRFEQDKRAVTRRRTSMCLR